MGKFFLRLVTTVHGKIVKVTGKFGGGTKDGSVLVLHHTGAKSGKERDTPVAFMNHNGGYAICGSMGGAPQHPGWYFNLKAHPDATVTIAREEIPVRARELEGEEREQVWSLFTAFDKRWAQYQSKTERLLPLMALDPR